MTDLVDSLEANIEELQTKAGEVVSYDKLKYSYYCGEISGLRTAIKGLKELKEKQ